MGKSSKIETRDESRAERRGRRDERNSSNETIPVDICTSRTEKFGQDMDNTGRELTTVERDEWRTAKEKDKRIRG